MAVDVSVGGRVVLAVGAGVLLMWAAAHVMAWKTLGAVDALKFMILAPLTRVLCKVRVQVGIAMAQLSSPATSLLLVGTVNLELQCGLSLSLIFKDLKGVPLG